MEKPLYEQRKALRLKGYDYSEAGFYFVTICSFKRKCIFGKIESARFVPTFLGRIITERWKLIPAFFPLASLDLFVLMPNHLHGIIQLIDSRRDSLSKIVNGFKAGVSREAKPLNIELPIWQRSFHDRIIRDEESLVALRQYIVDNPVQWHADELNPSRF